MKRWVLFLFILILFPSVNALKFTDSETKNGFMVDWYLAKDGISNTEYIINITNLENEVRSLNLSSIFSPVDYRAQALNNIRFYEYEEKPIYNSTGVYYEWTESKPIFFDIRPGKRKDNYDIINIGKLETKIFKLTFSVPINIKERYYGSSTQIFLGIDNEVFHPWLNISYFSRLYLYGLDSPVLKHIKRISIDTRTLKLGESIRDDCFDLRVTDGDNNEVEYRLVSGCLTSNTVLDIELPANTTDLYIYHNYDLAGNISNASVIFDTVSPFPVLDFSVFNIPGNASNSVWGDKYNDLNGMEFNGVNSRIEKDSVVYNLSLGKAFSFWMQKNVSNGVDIALGLTGSETTSYISLFSDGSIYLETNTNSDFASGTYTTDTDPHYYVISCINDYCTIIVDSVNTTTDGVITSDVVTFDQIGRRGLVTNFCNCTMYNIRYYNRTVGIAEAQNNFNGTDPINETGQIFYMPFEEYLPNYIVDYQEFSPLYASEQEAVGVPFWNFTAPVDSSIYDIEIQLDNKDDNGKLAKNSFAITTNTFMFYGNVTGVGCANIFGVGGCVAKKWDACLQDRVNISIKCEIVFDYLDYSRTEFRYGAGGSDIFVGPLEDVYTELMAGSQAHISEPDNFEFIECCLPTIDNTHFLAYPKELIFISNHENNDITVKYQRDVALEEIITSQKDKPKGFFGFLISLKEAVTSFLSISFKIISFGFGLLIFFIGNIWLVFIIFEIFAMMYALKSTDTISEYIGAYVNAHVRGLEVSVAVLGLLFRFVLSIINAIANLIPFT